MTRVSLTEAYDDRSVISKLKKMEDKVAENTDVVHSAEESARQSAQSAQETADRFAGSVGAVVQNANQQINASKALVNEAKSEVDATVTTVAQAVQTANNASASAQASAQTVAGYGDRLTAVEDKAQGNSADIQHLEIETRDIYDRDANSVKLSPSADQTIKRKLTHENTAVFKDTVDFDRNIGLLRHHHSDIVYGTTAGVWNSDIHYDNAGKELGRQALVVEPNGCNWYIRALKGANTTVTLGLVNSEEASYAYCPTPPKDGISTGIVTKAFVSGTNPATKLNNLVHDVDDETINGTKDFTSPIQGTFDHFMAGPSSRWKRLYTRTNTNLVQSFMFVGGQTIGFVLVGDDIHTRIMTSSSRTYPQPIFKLCTGANGEVSVHMKGSYSAATHLYMINNFRYSANYAKDYGIRIDNIDEDEPVLGTEYTVIRDSQDFEVVR